MILGTDISFYQRKDASTLGADFFKMRSAGAKFVIIRVGQNTWIDRDFHYNWSRAKDILPRGSYWFYDSRSNPKVQAKLWTDQLSDSGELEHFGDFEERYGGQYGGWRNFKIFMEESQRLKPNLRFGVYTAYYYWMEKTFDITKDAENYFSSLPLWIANYGVSKPLAPKIWDSWDYWQWTEKGDGATYGVESASIDLNYKAEPIPPIEEGDKGIMYRATVINNGTRLRVDHNTFATVITSYGANQIVEGPEVWEAAADGLEVRKGDKWIYVTHVNGVKIPVPGWMAVTHLGIPLCRNLEFLGDNPPTDPPTKPIVSVTVKIAGYKPVTVDVEPDGN